MPDPQPKSDPECARHGAVSRAETNRRTSRLREELREWQKREAVGELAGSVAHDYNNRLGVIFGNLYLLRSHYKADAKAQRWLETILSASRQLSEMTEDLQHRCQDQEQMRGPVDAHAAVGEIAAVLEEILDPRIRIRTELQSDPLAAAGSRIQVQGILFNLALNAAEAIGEAGTITLRTATAPGGPPEETYPLQRSWLEREGPMVHIQVEDTGCGIPADSLEQAMEPFYTTKSAAGRLGLGLPAVRRAVRSLGGALAIQSAPAGGTAAHVFLPLAATPAPASASPESGPEAAPGPRKHESGKRILLVDDERDILEVVEAALLEDGYKVVTHTDGQEALDDFQARPGAFDLVLLDLILPRMSGAEICSRIKAMRADVPVILSSGYSARQAQAAVASAEARAFLKKPYDIEELLQMVADAVSA
jgi:CheY-like chemotaxis protein